MQHSAPTGVNFDQLNRKETWTPFKQDLNLVKKHDQNNVQFQKWRNVESVLDVEKTAALYVPSVVSCVKNVQQFIQITCKLYFKSKKQPFKKSFKKVI